MANVAGKDKRISDIASMLEQGFERKTILQKITKLYKVSAGTIDKEIKEAKNVVFERNAHKEKIRLNQTEQTIKDAVNEAILSDLEIEGILCKIASGNMQVQEMLNGIPVLRDINPNEIINAAKVIYLKRGSNAPTKINQTISGGIAILENDPIADDTNNDSTP